MSCLFHSLFLRLDSWSQFNWSEGFHLIPAGESLAIGRTILLQVFSPLNIPERERVGLVSLTALGLVIIAWDCAASFVLFLL
jgi:hypothetical protein